MDPLINYLRGGTDGLTLLVAFGIVGLKIFFRWFMSHKPIVSRTICGADFLSGATIVPFLMMIAAVFFQSVRTYMQNGFLSNAVAGGIGLIFVLGEILAPPNSKDIGSTPKAS